MKKNFHKRAEKWIVLLTMIVCTQMQTAWTLVNPFDKSGDQARLHYLEKDFKKALNIYQDFPTPQQQLPLLLHNISMVKSHLGQNDAEETFLKAIAEIKKWSPLNDKKKEQLANMYFNLAHHHFTRGFYEKAAKMYKKNLQLYPDDISARHHLELALLRMQKKNQSKKEDLNKQQQQKKSPQKAKEDPQQKNKANPNQDQKPQQTNAKHSKKKSKFSRKEAKRILKKLEQTASNKKDLRVYREVINSQSLEKQW